MNKTNKLSLFGCMGVLANIVFHIVYDFVQWYFWDAYLYGGGVYPELLDSYGGLIEETNFILFFLFLGFTAGVALSWLVGEKDK